nr:ankyrin repeat domain-containing protein [Marinobacter sp. ATCH36]
MEARDIRGRTPLMAAAVNNRPEAVRVLISREAELDIQEKENGQTALIWAVRNRNPEIVRLLLSAGADADVENREGQTAKDLALLASTEEEGEGVKRVREALGCGDEPEEGRENQD